MKTCTLNTAVVLAWLRTLVRIKPSNRVRDGPSQVVKKHEDQKAGADKRHGRSNSHKPSQILAHEQRRVGTPAGLFEDDETLERKEVRHICEFIHNTPTSKRSHQGHEFTRPTRRLGGFEAPSGFGERQPKLQSASSVCQAATRTPPPQDG